MAFGSDKIAKEISLLYELLLGVGKGISIEENCAHFFPLLLNRKSLQFVSLWVKEPTVTGQSSFFKFAYAFPKFFIEKKGIKDSGIIWQRLQKESFFSITDSDENFHKYINEKKIDKGTFAIYKLQNVGFLKLYRPNTDAFDRYEMGQLSRVIDKFGLLIEGALAHERLKNRSNQLVALQKDLLKAENRYKLVVENLGEGIIMTDLQDKIIYVNAQLCEMTGFSADELIGQAANKMIIAEDGVIDMTNKIQDRINDKKETYDILHKRKDGSTWLGSVKATPFKNTEGEIVGTLGAVMDITDKREVQVNLKDTLSKLEDMFESMHDSMLVIDENGNIQDCNPAAKRLLGYEETDEVNVNIKTIVHPDDVEKSKTFFDKLLKDGSYSGYEGRIYTKDKQVRYVQVNSTARMDGDKFIGSRDVARDITARVNFENKLKESEKRLRQIFDTSLDSVINIDREGRIIEWNAQAEKTFGYTKKEVLGKKMSDYIIPEKYRDAHNNGMKHYLKTGHGPVLGNRIEISAIDRSGREFPIELSITPIAIDGQEIFSGFIRDITDRKKAEEEILQAKNTAEQAQKAEQQFLANMSHEIRTPMNGVIGMTHLLNETKLDDTQKDYLGSLRFAADSLLSIINNILDISKIESGALELEVREFDLTELLQSLQQSFQWKVIERPISVIFDIDEDIDFLLKGDPTRLTQILTNLLANATKFTERGTVGVQARKKQIVDNIIHIEFIVHDSGVGIEKDKIETIFENFKQADVSIRRKYGGTGLGLAIVKQLVELQKGKLRVESEPNEGSRFFVELPFECTDIKVDQIKSKRISTKEDEELLNDFKLLVVEDNAMNQKLIARTLEQWQANYVIAENGALAVEATEQEKFDLILMDIHMPVMDGLEATKLIRSDKSNLNYSTPIIALTAAALLEEKNKALQFGMNDYVTKPFSPKLLKKTIFKWLSDSKVEKKVAPKVKKEPTQSTINFNYLMELSNGDKEFVKEMVHTFLDTAPDQLVELKAYAKSESWKEVYSIAHRLKPNFQTVGLEQHQEKAAAIEALTKEETINVDTLKRLVSELVDDAQIQLDIVKQALTKFLSS